MKYLSAIILLLYALLSVYMIGRACLGYGYEMALTPLLTLIAFAFALVHGFHCLGPRRTILLLVLTFVVSLAFESLGVATGLVYGPYHYTDKLGPKFLGLVPYLIPAAWFMMVYPSYWIATSLVRYNGKLWLWRLWVAASGAVIMTAWDLGMDPVMAAGEHWVWEVEGAYFGIPLQNFWGWWLTTFVTFALFIILARIRPPLRQPEEQGSDRLAVLSYALTGGSTVITAVQNGLVGPALVVFFAMLPWVVAGWAKRGQCLGRPSFG
jgi:uncharacterized membrane protein